LRAAGRASAIPSEAGGDQVAEFSAADAAFTGFRVGLEHPVAVAIWAVLQFVVSLSFTLFVTVSAGPAFSKMAAMGFQPTADPNQVLGLFQQLAPTYAVLLIASLVFYSVLYAAMNRVVLRPEQSRFGYLRLAGDELRQLGLLALMAALGFALYIAVVIAVTVVFAVLSLALGAAGGVGVGLALAILLPAVICVFIYVAVRFSLASALTFASGRIELFGSWRLTKGRFWPLLGTYLIAFSLSLVVILATLAIAAAAVAIIGGGLGALTQVMQADMTSVGAILTPARLVYLAISAVGSAMSWPITMTPPAVIYRALAGGAVSRVFD
jgi:hypothetical protein